MSRCSLEKPSSEERCLRTMSPSSSVTGRPALLEQLRKQNAGDRRLAGAGQAGEKDREALVRPGRVAPAKLRRHLGEREPRRDITALRQALAQLGARYVEHPRAGGDLVDGHVLVAVLDVDHLLERHHPDAQLAGVLAEQRLGVVGAVEGLAGRVVARAGVVAADDEMAGPVVLADDGVPDRLSRARPCAWPGAAATSVAVACG